VKRHPSGVDAPSAWCASPHKAPVRRPSFTELSPESHEASPGRRLRRRDL